MVCRTVSVYDIRADGKTFAWAWHCLESHWRRVSWIYASATSEKSIEWIFNFRVVRTEDHSFAEQVRIASRARYLISNHGAGLTNMLFMNHGANVLELRHTTDRINNCYFTLASALNLKYFYQSCEPQKPGEDAHTADLKVDARALRANLELMLAS
jgi:capsular polysaccharide biosynthesis protein